MLSKTDARELIKKVSNHWLFPDFTNKLTWYIAVLGGTILATPTAFKEIFYNFLVDTVNLNSGKYFNLAELQASSVDQLVGLGLIVLALGHNLTYKYLLHKNNEFALEENKEKQSVDKALFKRFLHDFPSKGYSIPFLRDHDLGNSFHEVSLSEIEKFVEDWNNVEHHFLDHELEEKRAELWRKCLNFTNLLGTNSHDVKGGPRLTCIPEQYRGAYDYPEHVCIILKDLNMKATECYELHQGFLMFARQKLRC